jgi:hypothetical protein
MPALLPIIAATAHLWLTADRMPQLNIDPSCHAAATAAIAPNSNESNCKRQEEAARAKLEQTWGQFSNSLQSHCARLSTLGGYPSYVELLTCLEIGKAASGLPANSL